MKSCIYSLTKFLISIAVGLCIALIPQPTELLTSSALIFLGVFIAQRKDRTGGLPVTAGAYTGAAGAYPDRDPAADAGKRTGRGGGGAEPGQ